MTVRQAVNQFILRILQGKFLETYDRFYDEGVVVNDNGIYERKGKPANQLYLQTFWENLRIRHGVYALSVLVDGPKAVIEWSWDVTPKGGSRTALGRITLQTWAKHKIICERWYYQQPIRLPATFPIHNQYVYGSARDLCDKPFGREEGG